MPQNSPLRPKNWGAIFHERLNNKENVREHWEFFHPTISNTWGLKINKGRRKASLFALQKDFVPSFLFLLMRQTMFEGSNKRNFSRRWMRSVVKKERVDCNHKQCRICADWFSPILLFPNFVCVYFRILEKFVEYLRSITIILWGMICR